MSNPAYLRAQARDCLRALRRTGHAAVQLYLAERALDLAQKAEAIERGACVDALPPDYTEAPVDELVTMMAAHLRQRAAHCRAMARAARSAGIADELRTIAQEYDDDATNAESRTPASLVVRRLVTG